MLEPGDRWGVEEDVFVGELLRQLLAHVCVPKLRREKIIPLCVCESVQVCVCVCVLFSSITEGVTVNCGVKVRQMASPPDPQLPKGTERHTQVTHTQS